MHSGCSVLRSRVLNVQDPSTDPKTLNPKILNPLDLDFLDAVLECSFFFLEFCFDWHLCQACQAGLGLWRSATYCFDVFSVSRVPLAGSYCAIIRKKRVQQYTMYYNLL